MKTKNRLGRLANEPGMLLKTKQLSSASGNVIEKPDA
jgi:hypothetical protein